MKIGIIVINLDHSTDRLAKIAAQLQALNLPFERLSGIYSKDVPSSEFKSAYDPELNRARFYKVLSPGELACYISHQRSWRHLLATDWDAALIFEDDAIPLPEVPRALAAVRTIQRPWDVIKFGGVNSKPLIDEIPVDGGYTLCEYAKIPVCAFAQVISRQGAEKLLKNRARVARPVDVDLQHPWEHDCRIFGLTPYSVTVDDVPSETWTAQNRRASFRSHRLRFYRTKLRFSFEAFRYNIRQHGWLRTLRANVFRRFDQP